MTVPVGKIFYTDYTYGAIPIMGTRFDELREGSLLYVTSMKRFFVITSRKDGDTWMSFCSNGYHVQIRRSLTGLSENFDIIA